MATGKGMALFQQTVLTQPLSAMDKVSFKNFIGPFKKILDCTRFDIDKLSRKLQSWYEPPQRLYLWPRTRKRRQSGEEISLMLRLAYSTAVSK